MGMTKQEILDYFKDINALYNNPNMLDSLSNMIDELLKAKDINVPTKWVSVKDRLPENDRFVLACNDDGHMLVAQYIEETAQWQYKYTNYDVDVWDDEEQGPVCWWAELPEPPKEGVGE